MRRGAYIWILCLMSAYQKYIVTFRFLRCILILAGTLLMPVKWHQSLHIEASLSRFRNLVIKIGQVYSITIMLQSWPILITKLQNRDNEASIWRLWCHFRGMRRVPAKTNVYLRNLNIIIYFWYADIRHNIHISALLRISGARYILHCSVNYLRIRRTPEEIVYRQNCQ